MRLSNPNCTLCDLSGYTTEGSVCLKGEGGMKAKLVIFLDQPNFVEDRRGKSFCGKASDILRWMLARMSLNPKDCYLDYVLKCFKGSNKDISKKAHRLDFIQSCSCYRFATLQTIRPKAAIAMGSLSCEAFLGSDKVSNFEGTSWIPEEPKVRDYLERIWITFSPAYAEQSPAEIVGIYRTLRQAAIDAGLKPTVNENIKPYDYGY